MQDSEQVRRARQELETCIGVFVGQGLGEGEGAEDVPKIMRMVEKYVDARVAAAAVKPPEEARPHSTYKLFEYQLAEMLANYKRWVSEGKPVHGSSFNPKKKPTQYYYDDYHDHVQQEPDGSYSFNVQTFDSPEGDIWVRGKFVEEDGKIRILEQASYGN